VHAVQAREITIGIDIGTSSVKAVAADADGTIVRSARVPHVFSVPSPQRFEHDARCWADGPMRALAELGAADLHPRGVSVAAMVPSLTAVDDDGRAIAPGLLYGDERGHAPDGVQPGHPGESGELGRFLGWLAAAAPHAHGYWPAQAVANHALCGQPVLSTTAAAACWPLFDFRGWSEDLVGAAGARVDQMPTLVPGGHAAGEVIGFDGCVLEGGTIDAMGEQIVAGCDEPGDVLVICGTTLIVWEVTAEPVSVAGYHTIPHTTPGRSFIGGPSNAGGLFLDWARRLSAEGGEPPTPDRVPIWVPYPRGERVPLEDPTRRAQLVDLDLTHGPAALRRAAYEAAGFVTRRMLDASPVPAQRIVATGGGVRVEEWLQCLADATGLPVDVVAVPEGGALGAAWLARQAAGLESSLDGARRWARTARRVEPDAAWVGPMAERYARWRELAD
jgi:xylulokinase